MIYSERTKKAMSLILKAHEGQFDKGGYPYVYHPIHVAEQMKDESTCLVGLLHDVVEDCQGYTVKKVAEEVGLTKEESQALSLVTHIESVPYVEYCHNLCEDRIARAVKIADLEHNLDLSRVNGHKSKKYDLMVECLAFLKQREEAGE